MKCEQCGKVEEPKPKDENDKPRHGSEILASMHEYRMKDMCRIGDRDFCSMKCKDKWIEKYGIYSHETDIKFILSFNVLIIPTDRSLPDPCADVEILVNARVKDIEDKETNYMTLGFDVEKSEFTYRGEAIKFANGKEMAKRIREALMDKF